MHPLLDVVGNPGAARSGGNRYLNRQRTLAENRVSGPVAAMKYCRSTLVAAPEAGPRSLMTTVSSVTRTASPDRVHLLSTSDRMP